MDMKNKKLKHFLEVALHLFYANDKELLVNNTHEQAETHRIAHYLENNLPCSYKCKGYSVDVEYNRCGIEDKTCYKECKSCPQECICKNAVAEKYKRPDIILHKRNKNGKENNLLVIEAKKNDDTESDKKKLKYLTCNKSKYQYQLGVLVVLNKNNAKISYFEGGKEVETKELI